MKPEGIDALAAVGEFLAAHELPNVVPEQRSEIRAARKLLDEATRELEVLPGFAAIEIAELRAICERSSDDRQTLLAAAEERIAALQQSVREGRGGREILAGIYATLGRQAERRSPFQSVFRHEAPAMLAPGSTPPGEGNVTP